MEYLDLAKNIVNLYPLVNPKLEFIRHNENLTFKVSDESKNYLLRIHIPITKGMIGIQQSLVGLESEMTYLQELNKSGIRAQYPVKNVDGKYVTEYIEKETSFQCYATVLEWLEGSTLTLQEERIEKIAFSLGEYFGELHRFSKKYKSKDKLVRPSYGIEKLEKTIEELRHGVEVNIFTEEQYNIILETITKIKNQFENLNKTDDTWGLIHADCQLGNVIVDKNKIYLIDFSLSGFGYFFFDLASAASTLPKEHRVTFFEGYSMKMNFSYDNINYIEGFNLMDIFLSYALFIKGTNNTWIKDHFNKRTEKWCELYLNNHSFFLV